MNAYSLLMRDGSSRQGYLVQNDILKERVWKSGDDYIFESDVKKVTGGQSVLLDSARKLKI